MKTYLNNDAITAFTDDADLCFHDQVAISSIANEVNDLVDQYDGPAWEYFIEYLSSIVGREAAALFKGREAELTERI